MVLWAFALSAALAQEPAAPAPLVKSGALRVPLCPVAIELDPPTRRLLWVRLAFVPFGYRKGCRGRTVKECRELMFERRLPSWARRPKEPEGLLEIRVDGGQPDLLARLSTTRAVRELSGRKDAAWEAAGEGVEYPYDPRRTVTASVRWSVFVNGERLELLEAVR